MQAVRESHKPARADGRVSDNATHKGQIFAERMSERNIADDGAARALISKELKEIVRRAHAGPVPIIEGASNGVPSAHCQPEPLALRFKLAARRPGEAASVPASDRLLVTIFKQQRFTTASESGLAASRRGKAACVLASECLFAICDTTITAASDFKLVASCRGDDASVSDLDRLLAI